MGGGGWGMKGFVYVAMDPAQPGACCAIIVEEGDARWKKEVAKTVADWIRRGYIPERVTTDEGKLRLMKWVRPAKTVKAKKSGQGQLL